MFINNIQDIEINWEEFNCMDSIHKTRALENILMALSTNRKDITSILLSLHASCLININFDYSKEEDTWDNWSKYLTKNYETRDDIEECYKNYYGEE